METYYRPRGTRLQPGSRFREGVADFEKVTELDPAGDLHWHEAADDTHYDDSVFATFAMAHYRLGHSDEARTALDAARAMVAHQPQDAMRDCGWRD